MRNIALRLMYVGTAYHGWQVQKNAVTVAETLEHSLASVVGHPVKCTGAGRTDAGVHAETYIANFRTTMTIPCDRLPLAILANRQGEGLYGCCGYNVGTAQLLLRLAAALKNLEQSAETCYNIE